MKLTVFKRAGARFLAFMMKRARHDPFLLLSLIILAAFFFCAAFADFVAPHPYAGIDLANRFAPIGTPGFLLGTDYLGRDILSRLIYGTRIVTYIIALTTAISASFGIILGTIAGYKGGLVDTLISRGLDILLAFPPLLFALAIVAALGMGLNNAILATSIPAIAKFARIIRGSTLSLKQSPFVDISKMMGGGTLHILRQHIVPNIMSVTFVQVIMNISWSILTISGLSFLGLGVQPPLPEWGAMLSENRVYMRIAPQTVIMPGLAIFLIVLAWNSFGEAITDYLQPRWKERA